jgi:hypothetical protein
MSHDTDPRLFIQYIIARGGETPTHFRIESTGGLKRHNAARRCHLEVDHLGRGVCVMS